LLKYSPSNWKAGEQYGVLMVELLNGNEAAAYAAHYAGAKLVVGENEITAKITSFADFNGKVDDSLDAAIAATMDGKRVFVARNADMKKAALMRTPLVGMGDAFAARDSSTIIFLPENSQEVFDNIIMAYRACEDKKVLLPAVVGTDFLLTRTREPVYPQTQKIIENFLQSPQAEKPEKHIQTILPDTAEAHAVLQKSMDAAKKSLPDVFNDWKKKFHRIYGPVEKLMTDDADLVIVTYGSISGNAKLAVQKMREMGEKVGLLRIRVLRPFPAASLDVLKNAKKVAVVEPTFAPGSGGILHGEIKDGLPYCSSFICGKSLSVEDFMNIFKRLQATEKPERIWMV